jgi:nucleoside-diphosphate-sugar epimerase
MIAITGANGLLGNFILQRFVEENIPVVALKRETSVVDAALEKHPLITWRQADVLDSLSILTALEGVDTVVHTAALVSFDPRDRKKLLETNVDGTKHVVDACLALKVPRMIHVSSVAALGRQKNVTEISEKSTWVENALNSDYAKSKYLAELEVYRGQEEGLSIAMVNPSIILAPDLQLRSSAQIFKYVIEERKFFIAGQINFVDVRDVVEIIYRVYQKKPEGEKFIANGGNIQLQILLKSIADRLNKKSPSIKINTSLVAIAAWVEELRCKITGARAVISRQSVRSSREKFTYSNTKSVSQLGIRYHSIEETLDWCCEQLKGSFTTNK